MLLGVSLPPLMSVNIIMFNKVGSVNEPNAFAVNSNKYISSNCMRNGGCSVSFSSLVFISLLRREHFSYKTGTLSWTIVQANYGVGIYTVRYGKIVSSVLWNFTFLTVRNSVLLICGISFSESDEVDKFPLLSISS